MAKISVLDEHEHRLSDISTVKVIVILDFSPVALVDGGQEADQLVVVNHDSEV